MLTRLVESGHQRQRPLLQASFSLGLHVMIAATVIIATKRVATAGENRPYVHAQPYHLPPAAPTPTARGPAAPAQPTSPLAPLPADVVMVAPPTGLESSLPPIKSGVAIDPRRFVVGPAPLACAACSVDDVGPAGTILEAHTVDQPVEVLVAPEPRYPAALKAAGITGRVTVEFVVDTAGRVERESIKILESTAAGFSASVVPALVGARYRPALVRNRPVRQLVRQVMSFRID
ncbi:MAG: TonB family protein [Gemmatimonadales bacterium]